jgi:hypothetical protein
LNLFLGGGAALAFESFLKGLADQPCEFGIFLLQFGNDIFGKLDGFSGRRYVLQFFDDALNAAHLAKGFLQPCLERSHFTGGALEVFELLFGDLHIFRRYDLGLILAFRFGFRAVLGLGFGLGLRLGLYLGGFRFGLRGRRCRWRFVLEAFVKVEVRLLVIV